VWSGGLGGEPGERNRLRGRSCITSREGGSKIRQLGLGSTVHRHRHQDRNWSRRLGRKGSPSKGGTYPPPKPPTYTLAIPHLLPHTSLVRVQSPPEITHTVPLILWPTCLPPSPRTPKETTRILPLVYSVLYRRERSSSLEPDQLPLASRVAKLPKLLSYYRSKSGL
jgi:hypothetical protein